MFRTAKIDIVSQHNEGTQLRGPLKPLSTIMLWCSMGFRGAFNWMHMMPRDVSLSDSWMPDRCSFPTWYLSQLTDNMRDYKLMHDFVSKHSILISATIFEGKGYILYDINNFENTSFFESFSSLNSICNYFLKNVKRYPGIRTRALQCIPSVKKGT